MESALRPREIQTRIRAGESIDDVARAAGVPIERIEPYAGPVLAEREHIAGQAQRGSVRRRGETSGHRVLRGAVSERLTARGIDPDTVEWDSARMDDGRWSVSANYASGEAEREAVFYFDPRGRFSVAGNDEARWLLGEQSPTHGPQPGRRSPTPFGSGEDVDGEPTLDLNDELALVRAIQEPVDTDDARSDPAPPEPTSAWVAESIEAEIEIETIEIDVETTVVRLVAEPEAPEAESPASSENAPVEAEEESSDLAPELDEASELDLLFDMLGGEGYSEDSARVYPGLTEAGPDGGWEPAVVVNYPVEPEPEEDAGPVDGPTDDQPAGGKVDPVEEQIELYASDDTSQEELAGEENPVDEPEELELPLDDPGELPPAPNAVSDNDASLEDAVPESAEAPAAAAAAGSKISGAPLDEPEPAPAQAAKKAAPKKRKRAEVPSWDEIMFGGPKRP